MNMDSRATPVLFLVFNRPETTEKVFQRIRQAKPRRLFVSADGPRLNKDGERERCEATRSLIRGIDWDCELHTNYSENNLGCRVAVSSGIDWFFTNVDEGIILEDDCVPDLSFFGFCSALLDHYRNDERIMHIGGVNFQDGVTRGSGSYYYSRINHVWGWATWKRAWAKYDVNVATLPRMIEQHVFESIFPDRAMRDYWMKSFDLVFKKQKDTWDIQWQYAMSINDGLAILPNQNLISNIGFDIGATHTIDSFHDLSNRPTVALEAMVHPELVVPDSEADLYAFRKYTNPRKVRKLWYLIRRFMASKKATS
jgi:hypothetical protein